MAWGKFVHLLGCENFGHPNTLWTALSTTHQPYNWTFPNRIVSLITNEWLLQVAYGKTCPTLGALMYSLGNKTIVWVVWKVRTDILLADLIYFEVQCLPRSAHLKIFLIFVILMASFKSAYTFLTKLLFFYISAFLSVFFFASFFFYYYLSIFLHLTKTIFCRKRLCFMFPCVSLYRWIHFPRSVLSVLSTSPVVVHSFLRKRRMFSFIIHEITLVVVLYTSLWLVEIKCPQTTTSLCWLSQCDRIVSRSVHGNQTYLLDKFPPGHPKMFERMLDIISLFVLAISNTINLFRNCLCCSLWKR